MSMYVDEVRGIAENILTEIGIIVRNEDGKTFSQSQEFTNMLHSILDDPEMMEEFQVELDKADLMTNRSENVEALAAIAEINLWISQKKLNFNTRYNYDEQDMTIAYWGVYLKKLRREGN